MCTKGACRTDIRWLLAAHLSSCNPAHPNDSFAGMAYPHNMNTLPRNATVDVLAMSLLSANAFWLPIICHHFACHGLKLSLPQFAMASGQAFSWSLCMVLCDQVSIRCAIA